MALMLEPFENTTDAETPMSTYELSTAFLQLCVRVFSTADCAGLGGSSLGGFSLGGVEVGGSILYNSDMTLVNKFDYNHIGDAPMYDKKATIGCNAYLLA